MKHTGKYFCQTVYAYTIDSAISFAFSVPQSSSVNFKANGIAAPIPLPVVTCPSVTAASCTTCAQSSPSSKDGYAHAFLPFKIPSSLKILGAAQIAARYFFFLSNSPIRFRGLHALSDSAFPAFRPEVRAYPHPKNPSPQTADPLPQ